MNVPSPQFTYRARVVKVIDGDTVDLDIDLGMHVWKHEERIRLLDVHAAELRGAEKEAGLAAKDFLTRLLPVGELVVITTIKDKSDKYGRLLGDIWNGANAHVNELMRQHAPPAGR